jgi:enoyl-CoA hydratase/carnithine racemase
VSVVRFDIVDTLGRITLTSPPYNFVSAQFNTDLAAAVHEASDSEIRALLIRAEGPNFSVGGAAHEWPGKSYSWFRTFIAEVTNTYRAIEALQIPVVAAVRGKTGGGGLELALSADFIVTADDTVMWCAEVIKGQMPLAGGYQRLASLIGPSAARRMVMLGEPTPVTTIPAVADCIVPDDQLDETALQLATRLSQGPTRSYAAAKSVHKAWSAGGIAAADKLMPDLTMGLYHTDDFQQGLKDPQKGLDAQLAALERGEQPDSSGTTFRGR